MCQQHSPCPAVELQSLMGDVVVCRHLEKHINRNQNFCLTSPKRTSHSAPSESQAHTHPLPPPPPPCLHADSLSLSFTTFASLALLSGFTDQWREQLHQRRSGGLEMKRCMAVGKHLATVRGAEGVEGGRCAAGSLGLAVAFQRGILSLQHRTLNHKRGNTHGARLKPAPSQAVNVTIRHGRTLRHQSFQGDPFLTRGVTSICITNEQCLKAPAKHVISYMASNVASTTGESAWQHKVRTTWNTWRGAGSRNLPSTVFPLCFEEWRVD